jgi:hypothetical protein
MKPLLFLALAVSALAGEPLATCPRENAALNGWLKIEAAYHAKLAAIKAESAANTAAMNAQCAQRCFNLASAKPAPVAPVAVQTIPPPVVQNFVIIAAPVHGAYPYITLPRYH